MDEQVVGAMMSCRVHEDGKTCNANEVCFGDERTSKIYNQATLLAKGCPKAAEQTMHTKCLSAIRCPKAAEQAMHTKCLLAMRCPKVAEQGMQTPFYDHFDHRDHLV